MSGVAERATAPVISASRSDYRLESLAVTELTRGQRVPVSPPYERTIDVGVSIGAPSGIVTDVSCFGVDAAGQLSDDRYMVFYNQPSTPCSSLQMSRVGGPEQTRFDCTLATLPPNITRLVFTVSIDGSAGVSTFLPSYIRVGSDLRYSFTGADFTTETSLILGELYRKDGGWRFNAVGQGFAGGLPALLRHFGGEESDAGPSPAPAPSPPAPTPVVVPPSTPPVPVVTPPVSPPVPVDQRPSPPAPVEPPLPEVDDDDDSGGVLTPWSTPNPYLRRLFEMKEFGQVPGKALAAFRETVIDPEERVLAAFRSNHGPGRMGYVYLTTECMRWIQRFPLKNDDYFSYGDFDCPNNVIQTINGKQFQIRGLMVGRRFNKLLRVVEQAIIWSNQNER